MRFIGKKYSDDDRVNGVLRTGLNGSLMVVSMLRGFDVTALYEDGDAQSDYALKEGEPLSIGLVLLPSETQYQMDSPILTFLNGLRCGLHMEKKETLGQEEMR